MPFPLLALVSGVAVAAGIIRTKNKNKPNLGTILLNKRPVVNPKWEDVVARAQALDTQYQQFIQKHIDPLFGQQRREQIMLLSGEEEFLEMTPEEKEVNRYLGLNVVALGCAVLGHAVSPLFFTASFAVGLLIIRQFYGFASKQWREERRVTVDHLFTLYAVGVWFGGYFLGGALGTLFFTTSKKLVLTTEYQSRQKLANVFGKQTRSVWVQKDGYEIEIPYEMLQLGDTLIIYTGQVIPADGVIIKGNALIDQHMLTGESQPVEKRVGDTVLASTVVLTSHIHVQVEKAGDETVAAQIAQVLNNAADFKSSVESWALEISHKSVLPTLGVSLLAFPVAGASGSLAVLGTNYASSLLMLGPISMLNYLNVVADKGILVKDGRALEWLNDVDTVIFDKTGTLTLEIPTVAYVHAYNGMDENELLTMVAAAEFRQVHPIAKAILQEAERRGLQPPVVSESHYELGYGVKVQLPQNDSSGPASLLLSVGSLRFMEMEGIQIPPHVLEQQRQSQQGHSWVMVAINQELAGAIELKPTIRPEARKAVQDLHQRGLSVYIISGDQETPTKELARELGIDHYFANILPAGKADLVKELQADGHQICFVGDGINDALALQAANVSISLRGATTIATDTAQIVLMSQTLDQLPELFDVAKDMKKNIRSVFSTSLGSGLICTFGIFFLHFGIVAVELMFALSTIVGLGITVKPWLKNKQRNDD